MQTNYLTLLYPLGDQLAFLGLKCFLLFSSTFCLLSLTLARDSCSFSCNSLGIPSMGEYLKAGDPGDELEYGDPCFDGLGV